MAFNECSYFCLPVSFSFSVFFCCIVPGHPQTSRPMFCRFQKGHCSLRSHPVSCSWGLWVNVDVTSSSGGACGACCSLQSCSSVLKRLHADIIQAFIKGRLGQGRICFSEASVKGTLSIMRESLSYAFSLVPSVLFEWNKRALCLRK